jgi:tRNA 2-thiouridine synthesizing protein A
VRGAPGFDGEPTAVVDARGLRCPLPVVRLAQRARDAAPGDVIEVWATDPAARADIPAWCRLRGQDFLGQQEHPAAAAGDDDRGGGHTAYRVRLAR